MAKFGSNNLSMHQHPTENSVVQGIRSMLRVQSANRPWLSVIGLLVAIGLSAGCTAHSDPPIASDVDKDTADRNRQGARGSESGPRPAVSKKPNPDSNMTTPYP